MDATCSFLVLLTGSDAGTDAAALTAARRESELVEAAKAGATDAYERLVVEYQRFAYRIAYMVTRDAGDAEEATQDAFVKAYRSLPRFRRGAPFKPWLLKIVTNEARSRRLSSLRHGEIAARAFGQGGAGASESSAEASVLSAEQRVLLLSAIDALPEKLRDVVSCRYLLELSELDTAAALGIRAGTVKSRLFRALERLEAHLEGRL
jgi:RNA polymerase sigma-70 factor (ECF subfamily)